MYNVERWFKVEAKQHDCGLGQLQSNIQQET